MLPVVLLAKLATSNCGPDTKLLVVNALSLKTPWKDQFDSESTSNLEFTNNLGETKMVPTVAGEEVSERSVERIRKQCLVNHTGNFYSPLFCIKVLA